MSRHKDSNWDLPGPRLQNWEQAAVAVLMDIRDETKETNRLLRSVFQCTNFLSLPATLRTIKRNTTKRRRKPA